MGSVAAFTDERRISCIVSIRFFKWGCFYFFVCLHEVSSTTKTLALCADSEAKQSFTIANRSRILPLSRPSQHTWNCSENVFYERPTEGGNQPKSFLLWHDG